MARRATQLDHALTMAGMTREDLAKAWGVSIGRIGQIANGAGMNYEPALALTSYINGRAGGDVCTADLFLRRQRKEGRGRHTSTSRSNRSRAGNRPA